MRAIAAAVALGVVCFAGSARAATVLFFDSQPGDYIGQGIPHRFTDRDGTFTASHDSPNGVSIALAGGALGYWSLDFVAPLGSELVAGTYEGATRYPFQSPTVPGLSISGDGRGCNTLTGRFVVLNVTYGPTGDVLSFAADFEQHCEGGSEALLGSIRFRSGDAGCLGAPDGAACEDGDACTAASSCRAGACEAGAAIPCAPAGQCEATACSPTSGACVTRPVRDYTSCDDGDLCTAGESCMGGVCTGGFQALPCDDGDPCTADLCHDGACDFSQPTVCPDDGDPCTEQVCSPDLGCSPQQIAGCCGADADCDDGDPCTEDACEGARCVNRADACWSITGRVAATASALGKTAHLSRRFTGVLTIADDGSYRIPGGVCPQTGALYPDEVGRTQPASHGRLRLEATNRLALDAALAACVGRPVRVLGPRTWVKISTDQQTLRGGSSLRAHTRVRGVPVTVAITERFRGTRVVGGFGLGAGGLSRGMLAEHMSSLPR